MSWWLLLLLLYYAKTKVAQSKYIKSLRLASFCVSSAKGAEIQVYRKRQLI